MIYDPDMTWADLEGKAQREARSLLNGLKNGREVYREWLSFRDGRSDATIATALSKTEAEITDLRKCFLAMDEIWDFADNVASPIQGDRLADLRKFS